MIFVFLCHQQLLYEACFAMGLVWAVAYLKTLNENAEKGIFRAQIFSFHEN